MDFLLDEDLLFMKKVVRDFVDNEVDPLAMRIEEEDEIPGSIMAKSREMGLFGLSMPVEYGGQGLGMVGKCAIFEELGRTHNGFTTVIGGHNGIGSVGIVELGTSEQKAQYLPDMASGEVIGAFALTEPEAGSDASNLRTTASREGDDYVLNGLKHFITNAPIAGVFTVMAATDRSKGVRGITAFIVTSDCSGLRIGTIEKKMGLRGSHTSEVIFDNCHVPSANVLGREGDGYVNALKILTNGRAGLAARNLGSCEKLLELMLHYAGQRVQFGKPIIENQVLQHMMADTAMEVEALRSLVYRVAWMVDQNAKVIKEAAMVKLFGSEVFNRIADRAVQIFGGMGYMKELPIERFYRDARITRIYEGTSEIQRSIIAAQLRKEFSV